MSSRKRTSEIFRDVAKQLGYTYGLIDSPYSDAVYITNGNRYFITGTKTSYGLYPINAKFAEFLADDKAATKRVLKKFGFRIIRGKLFYLTAPPYSPILPKDRASAAYAYAKKIGYPVFTKPNNGSLGKNARIIFNQHGLKSHIEKMRADGVTAFLIEKFTERPEYRIFVVGGKVQFMYKKKRASLVGTGKHTIAELLADLKVQPDHDFLTQILKKEGKKKNHILAEQRELILQDTGNISTGAEITEYRQEVPKKVHDWARRLYRITGLEVYGVDVFTKGNWNEPSEYLIIEVNANPSLLGIYRTGHKRTVQDICTLIMKRFFSAKG